MENFSHSRKPNRGFTQATALGTKPTSTAYNGGTYFPGKTMYDDVFGGPPRFGSIGGRNLSPRPEDYTEIFSGFQASRGASIPVLDLPSLDYSDEVMFDVRNPRFNYAEVFGGFDGLDFAASYEELMREACGGDDHDHRSDSSDEAWMQAETESLSEGSDHSGKYQYFANGDYYEPIDSRMEFSTSYDKANLRSNGDISNNGITHVFEIHADPDYIIETPLEKTDYKSPPFHGSDDINLELSGGLTKNKHLRRTVSHPSDQTAGDQTFTNESTQKEYRRNHSSNEMFVTISEINLRTIPSDVPPPSRPPPLFDSKNGDYQNGQHDACGVRTGDSSPPFFDVEIDASSAAAASAAAMKEAMDKAQAKLKTAKELLERKREGIKNYTNPVAKSDGKARKERTSMAVGGPSDMKNIERAQGSFVKEDGGIEISVREERQKAVKTQAPESLEGKKLLNVPVTFVVEKHGKESQSIQEYDEMDGADEWQEASQYFELVRTDKSKTGFEQTDTQQILIQSMKCYELQSKSKMENITALEQQLDDDRKVKALREDHELEKVESDMKTAKEICERGEFICMSKPAKEVHRHKGHEKKAKAAQEVNELQDNGHPIAARKPLGNGKKLTGAEDTGRHEKLVNAQRKENKDEVMQVMEQKENGQQDQEASKSIENLKSIKECQKRGNEQKIWREVFDQDKNETKVNRVLIQAENEKKLTEALEQKEKEKRTKEACEQEENEKRLKNEAHALEDNQKRLKKEAREWEENEKRMKKEVCEQEENEKRLKEEAREREENEKKLKKEAPEQENEKRLKKEAHELEEYEKRLKEACQQEENEKKLKEAPEQQENDKRLKEARQQEENEKLLRKAREREENEKRLKEVREQEENEKRLREACEREENEKRLKEAREREEIEARELEESEKIWRMALEQLENEKRLKQARLQEENERKQRTALEQEKMENKQNEADENRLNEACEQEAVDYGSKDAYEKEETTKRLKEAHETETYKKVLEETDEQKDYSKPVKQVQDIEDEVKEKVVESEETEELQGVNYVYGQTEKGGNGKKLKVAEGIHQHVDVMDPVIAVEVNNLDYSKQHQENRSIGNNDQNCDELEEAVEFIFEENRKMEAKLRDEKKSQAMGKSVFDGKLNASGLASCNLEVKVNQFRTDDASVLGHQNDALKNAGEAGISIGQRKGEKSNIVPGIDTNNDYQGMKFAYDRSERARNIKEAEVPSSLEEDKSKFVSAQEVKESGQTGRKLQADKTSVLEGKGSIQGTVQQVKAIQSTERKDKNINENLATEEKEAERLNRENKLEKERLRKIEEERERQREREKDRMAVDRAALEARERGYAEACEKTGRIAVEKTTAESRQRAMAEARDRLEKACAEAREKSSMEARIRAERAAVERATAEARERAVEKAMAERAAFEARERMERSMSEKFSTSSRNSGMRTSSSSSDLQDQHFQSTGSFGALRYSYASACNVEGESAQRCKARLERYRRTAERAAKALEEKNMRDLLAQREQAERNRLAETLDADVKRWSSGKEGNLRALLSTLQYILGPESGWQPIPLTEVITSAAVKKAYRKATLCVHPDKLQQRGASIQQKYICGKVFDLLKEAWNKFNSEER